MYRVNDKIKFNDNGILKDGILFKISADGTFLIHMENGDNLRIYREDFIENKIY